MKILVVGGAGYIGSVLCRKLLTKGHFVIVFDNLLFGGESLIDLLDDPNFKFILGDVRKEKDVAAALKSVDSVINLAAIVGEDLCLAQPKVALETNYTAACNLVEKAKKLGISRFLFASTCSNYGISKANTLATEESALNPISLYAETKVKAEDYILKLASNNFHPCVLRLATVFGLSPRMRFDLLVSEFVKEAFISNKLTVYKPNAWRPLIHVRDVAEAFMAVILAEHKKINKQVFNVGFDNYQKKGLVNLIKKEIPNLKIEILKDKGDRRDYRVSFEKINSVLGFKAVYSLKEGIQELLQVLRWGVFPDFQSYHYTNVGRQEK